MAKWVPVWRTFLIIAAGLAWLACGSERPELPPDPREPRRPAPSATPLDPFDLRLVPVQNLPPERRKLLVTLEAGRLRWRATKAEAYKLVVSRRCFCDAGTPFESEVRHGLAVSASGGVRSFGRLVQPALRTVEMLFSEADRFIYSSADNVAVTFDERFGYPSRIDIDRKRDWFDDELTWVAKLTVID